MIPTPVVLKAACFGVLATALIGCGVMSPPDSQLSKVQGAKSIAIISNAGRDVRVEYVGFTVFNNRSETIDISTWGMDQKILDLTQAHILGKYEIRSARYNSDLNPVGYLPLGYRLLGKDSGESAMRAIVEKVSRETSADLVLVLSSWAAAPSLRITNSSPYGERLTASVQLVLFDGKTQSEIYGRDQSVPCGPVKFDFRAANLKTAIEADRAALERQWLNCVEKNFATFFSSAGL
jgi:hypothetical protein